MDSWEDIEDEVEVIAVAQGAYEDEDEDGEVLDSWEEEDDDKPEAPQQPIKKKRNINQIIQERKEAEEKKQRELAAKKAALAAEESEDPLERKARLAKLEREADFQNASDLFGGVENAKVDVILPTEKSILDSCPTTKEGLDAYADALIKKVSSFKVKNAQKIAFLERSFRGMVDGLDYSDVRKLSSMLSTISNELQRAEKEKKGGKKNANKKAQVKIDSSTSRGNDDYYDDGGEYDDFM